MARIEQVEASVRMNLRESQKLYCEILVTAGYGTIKEYIDILGYEIPGNIN